MRRNNRFLGLSGVAMVLFLFLLFPCLYAQDAIPALSRPLEPLRIPGETKEMHRGMRLITVHDSLPASFTHSLDNVIEDESRSLSPFFQKLNDMTGPVRIVHIGDSHVRGHLYPLITRRCLGRKSERDVQLLENTLCRMTIHRGVQDIPLWIISD